MKTDTGKKLSESELCGLHSVLLEMLLEVDRVCKNSGIRYCLFMGTMLGAARHSGFIPWDDDLDVAMLRSDFEKFKEACQFNLDESRFFYQDHTTDPHYPWGYARLRRKGTEFVRQGQEHMRMQTGVFLDIFPLDGTPDFAPLRALHCFYCFILRKILYSEAGRKAARASALRKCYAVLNVIPKKWVFKQIDKLSKKPTNTRLVRVITFPTPRGKRLGYLRAWFENLDNIEFEGHLFPGIKNFHEFLEFSYGDYVKWPPVESRIGSHTATKFQLPTEQQNARYKIEAEVNDRGL